MRVKAKADGFYRGCLRPAGAEFEFHGKKPGKWMVPLDAPKGAPKAKPAATESTPVDNDLV